MDDLNRDGTSATRNKATGHSHCHSLLSNCSANYAVNNWRDCIHVYSKNGYFLRRLRPDSSVALSNNVELNSTSTVVVSVSNVSVSVSCRSRRRTSHLRRTSKFKLITKLVSY